MSKDAFTDYRAAEAVRASKGDYYAWIDKQLAVNKYITREKKLWKKSSTTKK